MSEANKFTISAGARNTSSTSTVNVTPSSNSNATGGGATLASSGTTWYSSMSSSTVMMVEDYCICNVCKAIVRIADQESHDEWHLKLQVLNKLVQSFVAKDISEMAAGLVLTDDLDE